MAALRGTAVCPLDFKMAQLPLDWETELLETGQVRVQKRAFASSQYSTAVKRFRTWGEPPVQPAARATLGDITNLPRKTVTQPKSPDLKTKMRGDAAFHTLSTEQRVLTEIHSRPLFRARPVPKTHYVAPADSSMSLRAPVKRLQHWGKASDFIPSVPFRALPLNQAMLACPTFQVKYENRPTIPDPPQLHTQTRAEQRAFSMSASLNTSWTTTTRGETPTQSQSLRENLRLLLGRMDSKSDAMDVDQCP